MVTTNQALILAVFTLAGFAALGIWHSRGRIRNLDDYTNARNTTGTGTTTATLVASGMGAWILFSPAETAALGGLSALIGYGIGSAAPMIAFVWLGPRIRRLIPQGHTITEYAQARFGMAMFVFIALVSVFYMFIFLSAEMTGIAGALGLIAGVPTWQTASLIGLFVVAYTAYGGLKASIFTDTVQVLVILPLLAFGIIGAMTALGGPGQVYQQASAANPTLFDLGFTEGLLFGAMLVIAILAAEMVNQSWWQRIYAAKDERVLRRSFAMTALVVVPMIFLAGVFGLVAAGLGLLGERGSASIGFFLVIQNALPEWIALVVVLLALLLVMSTADTLLNAIASLVTSDARRLLPDLDARALMPMARIVTVIVALGAAWIGAQGYSVLTLFLVADLFAAATFIPLLSGLYSRRVSQPGALGASLVGLAVGTMYFPPWRPTLAPAFAQLGILLPAADFLYSFAGAALFSALVVVFTSSLSTRSYDLRKLGNRMQRLEPHEEPGRGA